MRSTCVGVELRGANEALRKLKEEGLLRKGLIPRRVGGRLLIPVEDPARAAELVGGEVCEDDFEVSERGKTYKDLLKGALPDEVHASLPRSYDVVGDIAIIRLGEEHLPFGKAVAEAIMRVAKNVRVVYASLGVEGEWRVPRLVHLGGERRSETVHREYGVRIFVDVARAYFNPGLGEEHRRVAGLVRDGEVVADLFAGVGPFALHIARLRRALVFAVDINPWAISCLLRSLTMNRLVGRVAAVSGDARDFLSVVGDGVLDRVIMNLPHHATEFVPGVLPKLRCGGWAHVYVVATSPEEAVSAVSRRGLEPVGVRDVIDYAPRKWVFVVDSRKVC